MRRARVLTREAEQQSRLYSERLSEEAVRRPPEKIIVLIFAAYPRDQEQLRLDEDVRDITQQIRPSEVSSRWPT